MSGRTLWRAILLTLAAAAVPLLVIVIAQAIWKFGFQALTRDIAAIANVHPLMGAMSSLGVLLWWSSTAIWFFTAALRKRVDPQSPIAFYVYSGLLSAYLTLDDLFQIHEHLAPLHLLIPEPVMLGLLGLAICLYLVRFRQQWLGADAGLLLLSMICLAASVVSDTFTNPWVHGETDWAFLIEDGLKWIGICFWTGFCVVRCIAECQRLLSAATPNHTYPSVISRSASR